MNVSMPSLSPNTTAGRNTEAFNDGAGTLGNYADAKQHYSEAFEHFGKAGKNLLNGDIKGAASEAGEGAKSTGSATLDMMQGGLKIANHLPVKVPAPLNVVSDGRDIVNAYSNAYDHYGDTFSHFGKAGKNLANGDIKGALSEAGQGVKSDVSATLDMMEGGLTGSKYVVPEVAPLLGLIGTGVSWFRKWTGL